MTCEKRRERVKNNFFNIKPMRLKEYLTTVSKIMRIGGERKRVKSDVLK